ncbi:hypothetical protein [Gilvibacter sp.]|uniref:hypothetical protein n=1 Tax=Gilvibacter sp. TaxID=2729997 RepID=UPI003F4A210D
MKKIMLFSLLALLVMSCSNDDDNNVLDPVQQDQNDGQTGDDTSSDDSSDEAPAAIIRIVGVDADEDLVIISNLGGQPQEVGNYWLCLGPGRYGEVSGLTGEATLLGANETITLTFAMNDDADGLSLFSTNTFASTSPDVLLDYVQWGAGNGPRVGQAITAGRWDDAGAFVPFAGDYSFNGTADQFGSDFWE